MFPEEILQQRRSRATNAFGEHDTPVLVVAGEPIGKPGGLDQTYQFLPHPEYYWLSGSRRWGGVMAWLPGAGWTHFVRPVSATERLWEFDAEAPPGEDIANLASWLTEKAPRRVSLLGQPSQEFVATLQNDTGAAIELGHSDSLREKLDSARRPKDSAELALLDKAVLATVAGHAKARESIRPGVTERAVQIELEAEMFRHGATGMGYGTIVGAGTRAAILHSEPGATVIGESDLVLVDAGGEVDGYTADITRTYPAGGRFSDKQQAIYDIVLASELAGIESCTVGTEWHDVHRSCAAVLAQGLCDLGLLRGSVDGLLESGAIALFFPHGVGHMLGLGVRDVGGKLPERPAARKSCGAVVRVDLPLKEGFLMTVEPGIYFVPTLLDDPAKRELYADAVNWELVGDWVPVGGVRIEDNILISARGPQNLTQAIPK